MQIQSPTRPLGTRLSAANPVVDQPTAGKLYKFTSGQDGFDTNSYYYDTGKEIVVFDAQFTEPIAKQLLADIRAHSSNPIRYVVVTHPNPDKFNGVKVFQDQGARVVASEATAQAMPGVYAYKKHYFVDVAHMFTNETYPAEPHVDLTFKDQLDLPLAQGTVRLEELGQPGVSSNQTIAMLRTQEAAGSQREFDSLVVGDLIHNKTHAWFEGGLLNGNPTPSLDSWRRILDGLEASGASEVYGGRGDAAPLVPSAEAEKAYLHQVQDLVTDYVRQHGSAAVTGPDAAQHDKQVAQLVAQAFPDYQDTFMLDYSIYGLVNQIALQNHRGD